MKRTSASVIAFSLVSLVLAGGCGGSQAARAPSTAPSAPTTAPQEQQSGAAPSMAAPESDIAPRSKAESQEYPAPAAPPASQAPAPVAPVTPAPATAPTPAPAPARADRGSREASIRRAGAEFDAAQRALEAAAGDCASACRALGSMDRAAGHMCELASDVDDRRRCEAAKTRVQAARDRVRTTCGTCPGGPSVERSAPIPSQ